MTPWIWKKAVLMELLPGFEFSGQAVVGVQEAFDVVDDGILVDHAV